MSPYLTLLVIGKGSDLASLVFVLLDDNVQELKGKQPSHSIICYCQCFSHINDYYIQLCFAPLLELSENKHVSGVSVGSEVTLGLLLVFFSDTGYQSVWVESSDCSLWYKAEEAFANWIFPIDSCTESNDSLAEILWLCALLSATDKELIEFCIQCWSPIFPNFWWDSINLCCFGTFQFLCLW